MNKKLTAYLLLILATALWGIGSPIIKNSLFYIRPFEFLFWRFLVVSVLSLPFFIKYLKDNPLSLPSVYKILILGFFATVLNIGLGFMALDKTSVVEVAIIGSLNPIFVAIASAWILREKLSRNHRFGIALAVAGTVVAVAKPLIYSPGNHVLENLTGNILVIGAGITWIGFVILSKKWEGEYLKPFHIVVISSYLGTISFFLFSWIAYSSLPTSILTLPIQATRGILYMAIFGSLVAYTAYTKALTIIPTSRADVFNYLSHLWSIPLAVFWLKESFDPILIISAVLIIFGVYLSEKNDNKFEKNLKAHHLVQHR